MAVRLAVSVFGSHSRSRTPIIIHHGMLGSRLNWRSLADKMAKILNRTVYVLDARNHGESPHVPQMTYDLMSGDTISFFQREGLERSVLIGHSMGGKTAMSVALGHPEMVEKLIVVDVTPSSIPGKGDAEDLIQALKQLDIGVLHSRKEADIRLREQIPDIALRQFLLTNLITDGETGRLRWKVNLTAVEQSLPALKGFPRHFQSAFLGPVLFVGGANSNYISSERLPAIRRLFPRAQVKCVAGAGHWLHYERPEEFLKLTADFIDSAS